ncbi:hypothetical protein [Chloroflexus sp.]|uniref:hypothetical protein n=1 Tax=Chloroflexus sp. TaxID=1904827 RepID=UPI00257D434E|nr:hypothetical protein [Chloroflexus sp.]
MFSACGMGKVAGLRDTRATGPNVDVRPVLTQATVNVGMWNSASVGWILAVDY